MRIIVWILCFGLFACGLVIGFQSLPGGAWSEAEPSPGAAGIALVVAGITSIVAMVTAQSWKRQRALDSAANLRAQRVKVYEEVLTNAMRSFTGQRVEDIASERAKVVLWASPAVLSAFRSWFDFTVEIMDGSGGVLSVQQMGMAYTKLYACIAAVRDEIGVPDTPDEAQVMPVIFSDYASNQELLAGARQVSDRPH